MYCQDFAVHTLVGLPLFVACHGIKFQYIYKTGLYNPLGVWVVSMEIHDLQTQKSKVSAMETTLKVSGVTYSNMQPNMHLNTKTL